jgi:CheY-like chemotaxis protein
LSRHEALPDPRERDVGDLHANWRLARPGSLRVLVVEDDPDSRTVLCTLLERLGCVVLAAENGALALDLTSQADVDVVLTDLRMPVLDGVGLLHALRADARRQSWPVIAVTASSLEHERHVYLGMGFNDYVAKPYDFVSILQVLRDHAGAQWEPPDEAPTPANPSAPVAKEESAQRVNWADLLNWANDGEISALRQWFDETQGAGMADSLRGEVKKALARYDFEALVLLFRQAQQADLERR